MPPRIAYISLWFPKPSETFIFREVLNLWKMDLPIVVFTLYGELKQHLSREMSDVSYKVNRLGIPALKRMPFDLLFWLRCNPKVTWWLLKSIPFRRWKYLEVAGENIWAFFAGFTLARMFEENRIDHIHAVWANGPATAALVASKLTGIPYSFTGRAVDIYPQDGALVEKIRNSLFVTTDNQTNVPYLCKFAEGDAEKIHKIYNGIPLQHVAEAAVTMKPPFRLLALGRFDRIKAYDVLLRACRIIKDQGVHFHLVLAGDGPRRLLYKYLRWRLGLTEQVSFPGFFPYDLVSDLFCTADLFVMSSAVHSSGDRDGLPTVILEALRHRVPVVATDVCGTREVVIDGVTGYLVPEKNPQALASAMMRMLSDREKAIRMAETGRDLIIREFDQDINHKKYYDLFVKMAAKS
jgi:colanic acid/amylovoran biosynthesis glycosyltransferase